MTLPIHFPLPTLPSDAPRWARDLLQALTDILRMIGLEVNQMVLMGTELPEPTGSGRFFFDTVNKKLYFDDGVWNEV